MVAGWLHSYVEKKLLKYTNPNLQKMMDSTWREKGISHRQDYHDLNSIILLSLFAGGDFYKNLEAGLLHVYLDEHFSKVKTELMRRGVTGETADMLVYYLIRSLL
ncbi:MAG: hypothetical protein QXF40_02115 [Metallosphaera sp.]